MYVCVIECMTMGEERANKVTLNKMTLINLTLKKKKKCVFLRECVVVCGVLCCAVLWCGVVWCGVAGGGQSPDPPL
jgi:hypothetical protein